jgi:DNA-binding NtrC family response regulator
MTRATGAPISTRLIDGPNARLVIEEAELRVTGGPDRGLKIALSSDALTLGSSERCDIVLHDSTVSARHAEVQPTARGYFIRDLGSTNGTRIGGQLIERAPLCDGARITLGESTLTVQGRGTKLTIALAAPGDFAGLIAHSVKMRAFVANLEQIAASNATVLIEGETGTGKELAAQAVHKASARRKGPFVVFDCATAIPSLIAAELFGHERGAFTGARETRRGLIEEADSGTLFLDEIGELPLEMQPLLLGVVERKRSRRVGGKHDLAHDVRIVTATNRNLSEEVRAKRFREDLFHRLAVGRLRMPPLRERLEDLPVLADLFAYEAGTGLPPDALPPLLSYDWPGNVRELKNVVLRMTLQREKPEQALTHKRKRSTTLYDEAGNLRPWLDARQRAATDIERDYVTEVLRLSEGNLSRAAELAGITRQSLTNLALKHGLHRTSAG